MVGSDVERFDVEIVILLDRKLLDILIVNEGVYNPP